MTKHAVYATAVARNGQTTTFRVGLPVDWNTAQNRWERLDDRRRGGRDQAILWARRQYKINALEVRAVDYHGRGLGAERHSTAFPVPYRASRLI
jgi:hypothetical protein